MKQTLMNMDKDTRITIVILLLVIGLSFFYRLGDVPLIDRDEGAFSEATREMTLNNDYISTFLNSEPRYDKPILIYWFQLVSVKVFGINEFAFRLPSAIFAGLWVLMVFLFCRDYFDRKTSILAAVITATSLWTIIIGRAATADALLNLLLVLTMFSLYRYIISGRISILYQVFLWAGLGTLTKGPVAVVIPFFAGLVYYLSKKQFKPWLRAVLNPAGIAIFCLVTLPWYIVQYLKEGMPFIEGFFFKHNVDRYMSSMEGHAGSILYYLIFTFLIVLPYTSLLIRILPRVKLFRENDLDRFMWSWFFFVLVFFTASGTKLPHYLLYGGTPLFILMAKYRDSIKSRIAGLLPVFILGLIVLFLPEIVKIVIPMLNDEFAAAMLQEAGNAVSLSSRVICAVSIAAFVFLAFMKKYETWKCITIAAVINSFIMVQVLLQAVGYVMQNPVKEAALYAKDNNYSVVAWDIDNPSFSVYLRDITPLRKPVSGEIVFTKKKNLSKLSEYDVLYERGGFALAYVKKDSN
ncbi:MAG: glycosyltransferase family 39 protein [bacterium]|nr:glycosyltransferase family 39 protein [bacterium]